MTSIHFVTYLLRKYILILNNGIIILHPLFSTYIFIYLYDNQYFQSFILFVKQILFVFVLFLVIIGSVSYGFIRRKQIHVQDVSATQYENKSIDVIEQEQQVTMVPHISDADTSNQIDDCGELPSEDFVLEEKIRTKALRELICYCDGSYSSKSQIGYSGFRTSNGYGKYRPCLLHHPRNGSTESEVFAACLALQYTAKYHYDILTLYTDNSKVEQLLKRPKDKDYNDYWTFFKALEQCYEENKHFCIQVERVRGHSTWSEQRQCSIKREFAKTDQKVRQKRRRHERKRSFANKISDSPYITYSYRCDNRYIRFIGPETSGATIIITSSRPALSSFWAFKVN